MVGSLVWIEDPDEAWLDGEVVEIKVLSTSGKMVNAFNNIFVLEIFIIYVLLAEFCFSMCHLLFICHIYLCSLYFICNRYF